MTDERLNKREFELLGRVFAAEIQNQLPAQIGASKTVVQLAERGYIAPLTKILGSRFPVTVVGWELTQRGRIVYVRS